MNGPVAPTPLLIDCDTGIDDALALLYAAASAEAEIVGVGCVAGNVELPHVVHNTLAVLSLAGRDDIEVAAGRDAPLARPLRTAADTHGPTGLGYAELPASLSSVSARDAAELIISSARARPGELTLVTLGPLSNVAVALQREPALPTLLRRLVMMVGAYRSPGNTAPTMEWNAGVDPEALDATIKGWAACGPGVARPVAFGLDVTERAKLTPQHLERLVAMAGSRRPGVALHRRRAPLLLRVPQPLRRLLRRLHPRRAGGGSGAGPGSRPGRGTGRGGRAGGPLDERRDGHRLATRTGAAQPNLDIALEADTETFFERFVERIGALAVRRRSGR